MAEYASKGVAGAGLGLGIAGTALALLNGSGENGGGILNNVLGGNTGTYATRTEVAMAQQLAAKDSRIGLLESQVYTDQKIVDTYTAVMNKVDSLASEVRANKEAQAAINMNQAVLNGTTTATIGCIQSQVNQLLGLTKLVVPNSSVCPGWGNVTITPAAATTTT